MKRDLHGLFFSQVYICFMVNGSFKAFFFRFVSQPREIGPQARFGVRSKL